METSMTSRVTALREPDPESIRTSPYNNDAEQRLLGALLISNSAYARVSEFLYAEHFGYAVHGRIFAAIGKLIERGQIANPVTLKNLFDQDGALTEIGGAQYLFQLANSAVTIINAEDYGRIIHDLYLRRELISIGEDVVNDAFRQDLDDKLGGLHPSDLVIIAGRPSMGKTALATNIAFNAAKSYKSTRTPDGRTIAEDGAVVGFFSLEMSAEQLAARILAEESGISSDRIRRGDVNQANFDKFVQASHRLQMLNLFIDDTPALSVSALRTRSRRLMRQQGLGLIVIDYLQLLRPSVQVRTLENRVQEISDITRSLKALAKELNVPVLALSQLSRAVEQREDKRPMLADLRESGSIEQDADVVMFIFREEYYLARREPPRPDDGDKQANDEYEKWHKKFDSTYGLGEIIIAKQRHGPIGTVKLRFDAETTKFEDFAESDHLPEMR